VPAPVPRHCASVPAVAAAGGVAEDAAGRACASPVGPVATWAAGPGGEAGCASPVVPVAAWAAGPGGEAGCASPVEAGPVEAGPVKVAPVGAPVSWAGPCGLRVG